MAQVAVEALHMLITMTLVVVLAMRTPHCYALKMLKLIKMYDWKEKVKKPSNWA